MLGQNMAKYCTAPIFVFAVWQKYLPAGNYLQEANLGQSPRFVVLQASSLSGWQTNTNTHISEYQMVCWSGALALLNIYHWKAWLYWNGAWSWQEKLQQGVPVLLNVAFLSAASPLESSGGAFLSYGLHYQARLTSSFTSSKSSSMWKGSRRRRN